MMCWNLFACLSLLMMDVVWTDHCPSRCFCNKALTSVNCEGKGFMSVPPGLPKSVEKLYLQHNEIADLEEKSFCGLPQLQELYLQNNKLSVIKSLTFSGICLASLKIIRLDNNHIATLEENAFFNVSTLNITYLTNNYISSVNSNAFYQCSGMTFLQLAQNYLRSIPALQWLTLLQQLSLQGNKIKNATFPTSYEVSTSLATVGLSANEVENLTDNTFKSLRNSALRKLELSRNKITDISSGAFLPLTKLVSLVISLNPLTATKLQVGLEGLRSSALRSLNIARLNLGGRLPSSTFALLNGTGLKQLLMSNNQIIQLPSRAFASLKNLEQIELSGCKIQTIANDTFAGLSSLTNLNLADNSLDKVPKNLPSRLNILYLNGNQILALEENAFVNLVSLKNLYLGGNKISEVNKFAFRGLVGLQKLHLVSNSISSLAAELFAPFGRLISLELNKNNLKTIQNSPDIFSYMTSLLYLSLSENSCSSLPLVSFKHLQSLKYLFLDGNDLGNVIESDASGTLFSGLHKLETLSLSTNFLHTLPSQLFKDLTSLQTLNMKRNRISSWGNGIFKHTAALRSLDFSYNTISLVNSSSLEDLSKNTNFHMLNLSNNPFACTCDLRWFRDWVNQTKVEVANIEDYLCNTPGEWKGKHFLSFDRTKIVCVWFDLYFVIGVSVASALVVLVICIVLFKKRWWILYRCYRLNSYCCSSRSTRDGYQKVNGLDGDGWVYDAYLSYADDDYVWVLHHLLPDIDLGELTPETPFNGQFRLYFYDRDSIPGSSMISSISDNIERSKKVIIVLTKEYLSSAKHKFEIDLAVKLKSDGVIDDIIVINVEGVPFKCIPKSLQRKISREEFLLWENEDNAKKVFKEKLKRELNKVTKATEVEV
ncbi:insulin-like growth factor-binding protein complex acid labile subunit [Saccostrea echinata]|uniref:insulin-like growth factor-binding protein complex acid labile subunit n=1 Tax=Saccostrea echinata TaxID=191078 RepID=UPI002A811E54|nr:insulin-like growth factor-binding protein complex acid labile subunit [Saccostrea echinata]